MKLKLITVLSLLLSTSVFAECFEYDHSSTSISWTAFKTAKKVGVGGEFKSFKINPLKKSGTMKEVIQSSRFSITPSSVFTKNAARDKKIASFFFQDITINGMVSKVDDKYIEMALRMGPKAVNVPMKYTLNNGVLTAEGILDILDFGLTNNLTELNKACFALHEGKTWSDVKVKLVTTLKSCK